MCFSATASFTASAMLVPVGIYCVKKATHLQKPYWVIAALPLAFGIQQAFEGGVWMTLESGDPSATRLSALGFMFFSHLFWLFWIPISCSTVEDGALKKKIFLAFALIGAAHGLLMYIPLLFRADWLTVEVVRQSIDYKATFVYDGLIPRIAVRAFYAFIVLVPLILSSDGYIRVFGIIIAASVMTATVFFGYAFISVWCFFAATLSLYVVFLVYRKRALEASLTSNI